MMNRNISHEAAFLNGSGNREFAVAVMQRLAAGQHHYGDRWSTQSIHELLSEIEEETLDVAAWSALTTQIDTSMLSDTDVDRVIACLDELAHLAGKAYAVVTTAQRIAERHAIPDTTQVPA